MKKHKKMILTSERHKKHPFADQNPQQTNVKPHISFLALDEIIVLSTASNIVTEEISIFKFNLFSVFEKTKTEVTSLFFLRRVQFERIKKLFPPSK